MGRGKGTGLWGGRPEVTGPKGRAHGFPSLTWGSQTPSHSPPADEPDREHSSLIEAQICRLWLQLRLRRLRTWSPSPPGSSPALSCQARPKSSVGSSRIPPDLQKTGCQRFPSPDSGATG